MKNLAVFFTIFLISFSTSAQTIIRGADMMDGELQQGYYFLLKIDERILEKEWQEYLNAFGKSSEPEKLRFSTSKIKSDRIRNNNIRLESKISGFSDYTKIFCVVKDVNEYDERDVEEFLLDFVAKAQYNELVRLASYDLEEAQKLLSDNERDQKKVERDLENNLKMQERYGKYLDESPQKMVSLINEKQRIVEKQIGDEVDEKAAEELQREAKRKEREISKNKNQSKKYAKRLDKKEREFNELRDELFEIKRNVEIATSLVTAKKQSLEQLRR